MGILERIINLFQGYNWLIIPAAFLAVVFHEISHGLVAYCLGDNTAQKMGRLSVNPLKHIDVFGLICMMIFGFGWAKPVTINPYFFKKRKLGIILVSLAGPLSNIIQATLGIIIALLLSKITTQIIFLASLIEIIIQFFMIFSILNISLAMFNLIPIPPLDGSKILNAVLPARLYFKIMQYERYGFIILIILINTPIFGRLLGFFQNLLLSGFDWVQDKH